MSLVYHGSILLYSALGMIVAGALGDRLGPVLLLNAQGGMYVLSGLLVLLTLWKMIAGKPIRD